MEQTQVEQTAEIKRTPVKRKAPPNKQTQKTKERNPIIVPSELTKNEHWLGWIKKPGGKGKRFNKKPVNPTTGESLYWTKPENWNSFKVCHEHYMEGKADGVMLMLTEGDGLFSLDLDDCLNPDNPLMISTGASQILDDFNTYVEISPSGTGLRVVCKITGEKPQGKKFDFSKELGVEIFLRAPVTVTGQTYKPGEYGTEIRDRTEQLHKLIAKGREMKGKKEEEGDGDPIGPEDFVAFKTLSNEQVIEKVKQKVPELWGGDWSAYPSQSEADLALIGEIAFYRGPFPEEIAEIFRESDLYRPPPEKGRDYVTRTVKKALAGKTVFYTEKGLAEEKYRVLPGASEKEPPPVELEFPEVMDGVAGQFAEVYSTYLEAPPHFFYMAFLTALGATLADRLKLISAIEPQPRLYTILLGESATVRKSTVIQQTVKLFKDVPGDHLQICWGIGSPEGLQKRLKENNRLLVCFDEFKQFVSKCQITASVMLPCVNTLFESNMYENSTKTSDIRLDDAYLSILAASTTATYQNTWSPQFTDIGFNNRLFLVPGSAEKKFSIPHPIPRGEKTSLTIRLTKIFKRAEVDIWFKITPDARKLYHKWYLGIEDSVHSARLDTYAMRLMSLLAVNEDKKEVDIEITEKVIALCDWQLKVRHLHDPVDADNVIAKLEEQIRRALKRGALSMRDLKRFANANRAGLWFFEKAMKNLEKVGEIRWDGKRKKWTA